MELTVELAEQRLSALCGSLNVLHGQLVELVGEVVDSGVWRLEGIRTVEQWLRWQAGLSPATARHVVELAAAGVTHPRLSELLADGAISFDQAAAAITAPAHCDDVMARLAPLSTVSQIRTEARAARTTEPFAPPVADPEPPPAATEQLWWGADDEGRWVLRAELDAERGLLVEQALSEARDRLFRDGQRDVTWPDALVDVAARSLAGCEPARRDLYRVNVFVENDGRATWLDRTPLPDAVRRRLTCDATVTPVTTDGGLPVSVGRSQRIVPERTRRLVEHRDRGTCRVPWCDSRKGLEIHHVVHWEDGGATDTSNLIALCPACHRHHHRGLLHIAGDADRPAGLVFTRTPGLHDPPRIRPAPPPGPPPTPVRAYRHPLGEALDHDALTGIFPTLDRTIH